MCPKKFVTVSARMHAEKREKFDELLGTQTRNEFINKKIEELINERGNKTEVERVSGQEVQRDEPATGEKPAKSHREFEVDLDL